MTRLLLLITFISFGIQGCSDSDSVSGPAGSNPTGEAYLSAEINGHPFYASNASTIDGVTGYISFFPSSDFINLTVLGVDVNSGVYAESISVSLATSLSIADIPVGNQLPAPPDEFEDLECSPFLAIYMKTLPGAGDDDELDAQLGDDEDTDMFNLTITAHDTTNRIISGEFEFNVTDIFVDSLFEVRNGIFQNVRY